MLTAPQAPSRELDHVVAAGPVVVGIDFSETSQDALQRAAELARSLDVRLHIIMAVAQSRPTALCVGGDRFEFDQHTDARRRLGEIIAAVEFDNVTGELGPGRPASTLCREAERLGAETIVVGNRGTRGIGRVFGSVASNVMRRTSCDVVVVDTTPQ